LLLKQNLKLLSKWANCELHSLLPYGRNIMVLQPSMRKQNKKCDFIWVAPLEVKVCYSVLNTGCIMMHYDGLNM